MTTPTTPGYRAGLAALIGRTNAGKSTLLNALANAPIAIVTPKPQTTRHAIQGVVHRDDGQVVFVDTPGFFRTHRSRLVDRLHARAKGALAGIDVVVHLADPSRPIGDEDRMVLEALSVVSQPKLLCLGKSDLARRPFCDAWRERAADYAAVLDVSGQARRNLDVLVDTVFGFLPVGAPLYPPDEVTNAHRDFRIAETVREKVYLMTGEEVPYRTAVQLDHVRERHEKRAGAMLHVKCDILVAKERYKGMLIGAQGRKVRDIGIAARVDLERLLGRKVHLELAVRVDKSLPD